MEGTSGLLSSCDGYLREPIEIHKGIQASFQVSRGKSRLLLWHCWGKGPLLTLRQESCGFSQVPAGSLGSLSNFDGDIRESLVLPQGSQVSFRVVSGNVGLLSSHCRGIWPHLALRGESHCFFQVVAGSFGFLSS